MQIRDYQPIDLTAVVQLFTDSVHQLGAAQYDEQQRHAWAPTAPSLSEWETRLAKLETLVAHEQGVLAGFIGYTLSGYIDLLFTAPIFARRGVATALLTEAESRITAHGTTRLWTEASLVARPCFEQHGFEVLEEQLVIRREVSFRRFAMQKMLVTRTPPDSPQA